MPSIFGGGAERDKKTKIRSPHLRVGKTYVFRLSASDQPDALVLAILGDFGAEDPATMVRRLVEKLCALTGPDEKRLREYLSMLEILADNRHLASTFRNPIRHAAHQP